MSDEVYDTQRYVEGIIGAKVYLIGGAVRDTIMGNPVHDWDYATALHPDFIEAAVRASGRKPYTTGKRFGTIGFKHSDGSKYFEVTTFRGERYDGESRKPVVTFSDSLSFDQSRRDFTINSIAMRDGNLYDPHDGATDIANKLIRAVGNPTLRFKDDPLRMLRACRFASQLGFVIEEATLKSMNKNAHLIRRVAKERCLVELDKLLMGKHHAWGLVSLRMSGLLRHLLPELQLQVGYEQRSRFHNLQLWEHTLALVHALPADLDLRWAGLLHDVGKPSACVDKGDRNIFVHHESIGAMLAEGVCDRFRMSNARKDAIVGAVRYHLHDDSPLKEADNAAK